MKFFDTEKFTGDVVKMMNGLSLREVAQLCDVSHPTIHRVVRGEKPTMKTFEQLCCALWLDPVDYFTAPEGVIDGQMRLI